MFSKDTLTNFGQTETPFYYYDLALLRQTLQACLDASAPYNFHVHYAMKANFNPRVLDMVQLYGFGADCVSGGEVKAAAKHGFDKDKIVFAGVGKSDREINEALNLDIFCFNVESMQELRIINDMAQAKNKTARVAIRINPNVDAHTHHFITTGLEENKFGINTWELPAVAEALAQCPNLQFLGIHFHIGSQITDMDVYKNLCTRVNELQRWFEERNLPVKVLNLGGGLGIDYYHPDENPVCDFATYFKVFHDFLNIRPGQEIHFELGRALVAQSASLISRVLYVKNGMNKNFLILDAGMTELIRPMLYQAYHQIENISVIESGSPEDGKSESPEDRKSKSPEDGKSESRKDEARGNTEASKHESDLNTKYSVLNTQNKKYDVVGPICESTDCFRKDVEMPESKRGDLIAIRSAGAYGEVMASGYNLRERAVSVYAD